MMNEEITGQEAVKIRFKAMPSHAGCCERKLDQGGPFGKLTGCRRNRATGSSRRGSKRSGGTVHELTGCRRRIGCGVGSKK